MLRFDRDLWKLKLEELELMPRLSSRVLRCLRSMTFWYCLVVGLLCADQLGRRKLLRLGAAAGGPFGTGGRPTVGWWCCCCSCCCCVRARPVAAALALGARTRGV